MGYEKNSDAVFKAISDETRRSILVELSRRPMPVHEVAACFDVSRPAISKHLRVLADAGLVRARRDGKQNVYETEPAGLREVTDWANQFWSKRLSVLKQLAERKT